MSDTNRKIFFLIFIPVVLFVSRAYCQFPNAILFNTASNAPGTGTIPIGSNDLNWMAALSSSLGPYVPAVSCGNAAPGAWVTSPFPNANWISYPHGCSANPAEHSCLGNVNEYYRLIFNLPANACSGAINTPSAYCLSLDFYADNWVNQIWVNNNSVYLNPNPNAYNATGFMAGNQVTSTMCNFWQAGSNTVIVHIQSGAPNFPGWSGFLAQVNQTVNPVQNQSALSTTLAQTNVSCSGGNNGSATLNLSGGQAPYSYTWLPSGGNASVAAGLGAGVYTVLASGGGCTASSVFTITQSNQSSLSVSPNTVVCVGGVVTLTASGADSYTWSSGANTSTALISSPGIYTVTGFNLNTGCTATQTVSVAAGALPSVTVNPASQAITCNSAAITFSGTVSNPTVNVQHDWYSPLNPPPGGVPIISSNNTITLFNPTGYGPGVYTLVTTNLVTGCKTAKTITVTSLSAWPTFSLSSPTNFSVGCAPLQQTTISIINPVSTQSPPATCSYTFLPPTFTGAVTPSIILGVPTSTVTQIPGTWTVIVQDNSNFCRTEIAVPVIQNTVPPQVSASVLTQTLNCYHPTVVATGTSSTPFTNVSWLLPVSPPNYSQPTVVIGSNQTGPNTSTTSLVYASFTVVATNSVNACQSTSVVLFNQNFKPPVSSPTISIATPTAIYCTAASNPVVLTTGNSTTTSGGGPTAFVANACWQGPSPQTPTCGPSTYSAYVAGIYTLTVMDNYNGCTNSQTVMVLDKTQPPVIAQPAASATLDCGKNQATLNVSLTTSGGPLMYWFFQYPQGAAFSPTNAINTNGPNVFLSGTTSPSVNVSLNGTYLFVVTNTITGCQAFGRFVVTPGDLQALFDADKEFAYAPATVNFTNNSQSSLGSGSITSIWSFGNGVSQTTTNNINASTTYTAPGIYTVTLFAQKGSCLDTAYKVIKVDIPSKLEIPNIFSPNGDGANDVFFLKTAGLKSIEAIIYDRWGNKVYETTSSSGNIAWDGKNLQKQDCASGVYFYVISADGFDGQHYQNKGNVTLVR